MTSNEYKQFCLDIVDKVNNIKSNGIKIKAVYDNKSTVISITFESNSIFMKISQYVSMNMGRNIFSNSKNHKEKYKIALLRDIRRNLRVFRKDLVKNVIENEVRDFIK